MLTCSKCQGEGKVTYEEDGRTVTDACYHCATSGEVDEDMDFHDRLADVGKVLAYLAENEYRYHRNQDPEGEGYDFCAAENMMTGSDYFTVRCWDREPAILDKLGAMSRADQELMIAWNVMEPGPKLNLPKVAIEEVIEEVANRELFQAYGIKTEDDIPF